MEHSTLTLSSTSTRSTPPVTSATTTSSWSSFTATSSGDGLRWCLQYRCYLHGLWRLKHRYLGFRSLCQTAEHQDPIMGTSMSMMSYAKAIFAVSGVTTSRRPSMRRPSAITLLHGGLRLYTRINLVTFSTSLTTACTTTTFVQRRARP